MASLQAALVRLRQGVHALLARWETVDERPLAVLNDRERALFDRLPRADRLHALRVAQRLRPAGETHPSLLKAALLHDVGKAGQDIYLLHRVVRVLLRLAAPTWLDRIAADSQGWHRPFYALANHAALGALWIAESGSDSLTVALVRYHDATACPPALADNADLWRALQQADDQG